MRSVDEALQWLEGQINHPSQSWTRLCLSLAARAYGYSASGVASYGSPNPTTWFNSGKLRGLHRGDTNAPAGALYIWTSSSGPGHIAISDGHGNAYTNLSNGGVGKLPIKQMLSWGTFRGWATPAFPAGGYRVASGWDANNVGNGTGVGLQVNPNGSGPRWLVRFLASKGLTGDALKTAWAIAMRESGGDPGAVNDRNSNGSIDYGLFQINSSHQAELAKMGLTLEDMKDPDKAFQYFKRLSHNFTDWGPWNMGPNAYDPANSAYHTQKFNEWKAKFGQYARKAGIDPNNNYSYTGGSGVTSNGTDRLSPDELAAEYGFAVDVINSNKTLKKLFEQATAEQWSPAKFKAKLQSTQWYKEHSGYWRTAWAAEQLGGADWEQMLVTAKQQVKAAAVAMGADLPPGKLDDLAKRYLREGWGQDNRGDLMNRALSKFINLDGQMDGSSGDLAQKLRQLALGNGVKMDDSFYLSAARSVAAGLSTEADWANQIRTQAASMYPVYKDKIMAGMDVSDLASGYTNVAKQMLENDQIDLNDRLVQEALGGTVSADGTPQALGMWDFRKKIKKDPRWQYTSNASEEVGGLATNIAKMMGFF